MTSTGPDSWDPQFLQCHPAFWPLRPFAGDFVQAHAQWPDLADYQRFFEQGVGSRCSANNRPLRFVAQDARPKRFEDGYEPRIYLRGEIQTRLHNWHDFFQVMVWRIFPDTKVLLNKLHHDAIKQRLDNRPDQTRRSVRENMLTQYDECGAVILASDPDLLALIREFEWKSLFWQRRNELASQLKCIVFGHAVYEKLLQPYIGMTAHSVLIPVAQDLLEQSTQFIVAETDRLLTDIFSDTDNLRSPQDLFPFPLLGLPGWATNSSEAFYDNTGYFRPRRHNR
jgi:hypothetical protein